MSRAIPRFFSATVILLLCIAIPLRPHAASAVTIQFSPVGNPGNAADVGGFGAVPYSYGIGTYDVTNAQYVDFLNSNDPGGTNLLGLYNSHMSSSIGGINFTSGAPTASKYSVIPGDGNHPVNLVTWYNAIRFANWLNNGQVAGMTETGAYTLLGGTPTPSNANSIIRSTGATVFLPSEDEWYKAAYYNPVTSSYFQYPTSSNTAPTAVLPPGGSNSANFKDVVKNLSDVGAYTGTTSPYGVFDMGGNVNQWNEALVNGTLRGFRGGYFDSNAADLSSSLGRGSVSPSTQINLIGFRVASVPEPTTAVLAIVGCGLIWALRRRISCR